MQHPYLDLLEVFFIISAFIMFMTIFAKFHLFAEMQIIWYDFFNASRLMT